MNFGTLEFKKLIDFLLENGYTYSFVEDAIYLENNRTYIAEGDSMVTFEKFPIKAFNNKLDNYRNDGSIKIKIIYDNDFDHQNAEKYYEKIENEDKEIDYETKFNQEAADDFISELIELKK